MLLDDIFSLPLAAADALSMVIVLFTPYAPAKAQVSAYR